MLQLDLGCLARHLSIFVSGFSLSFEEACVIWRGMCHLKWHVLFEEACLIWSGVSNLKRHVEFEEAFTPLFVFRHQFLTVRPHLHLFIFLSPSPPSLFFLEKKRTATRRQPRPRRRCKRRKWSYHGRARKTLSERLSWPNFPIGTSCGQRFLLVSDFWWIGG